MLEFVLLLIQGSIQGLALLALVIFLSLAVIVTVIELWEDRQETNNTKEYQHESS